ncbi:zinc ABC transporter permease [Bifidobacterium xylocopae]|uniref:Zinc ABC transporter permease n=2 Tax=Bifidobacterium xylocopae TaxID=2493119 RepID=A0A366KCZ0_9BIFI|nr:zinc ABC transporter permease [Bifidobacterium xylocopae]
MVESLLPGLVFLFLFITTADLKLTVLAAGLLALVQLAVRLLGKQSWLGALTGLLAVGICLLWAWLSRDARSYYLPGFITNVAWILALGATLLCRAPGIGLVVEYVRHPVFSGFREWLDAWRGEKGLYRAYKLASILWMGLFSLRLAIQLPLYLSHRIVWLGTARLVMGLPLFALGIWVSWLLLAGPFHRRTLGHRTETEPPAGADESHADRHGTSGARDIRE